MQDVLIIGGGLVGLATAYQILNRQPGLKVTVIEKENRPAAHQSGNNSGVMHSGLYYRVGSLRATNCIRGYQWLKEFAEAEGIAHDICGKLVVSTGAEEEERLHKLYLNGLANGLEKISVVGPQEIKEIEPHCAGTKAIWVPYAGIISFKQVAERLTEKIRFQGGRVVFGEKVEQIREEPEGTVLRTSKANYRCKVLVNCAGLYSDKIAEMAGHTTSVKILPFRGEYHLLTKEAGYLVRNLIYPVPDPEFPFLGVHFTRMVDGGIEAGPNAVLAMAREGYTKEKINLPELIEILAYSGFQNLAFRYWKKGAGELYRSFYRPAMTTQLQKLIPKLKNSDLIRGGAGVRAMAVDRNGNLLDDFVFEESERQIHVINAPSPAATACLSVGHTIADMALAKQS